MGVRQRGDVPGLAEALDAPANLRLPVGEQFEAPLPLAQQAGLDVRQGAVKHLVVGAETSVPGRPSIRAAYSARMAAARGRSLAASSASGLARGFWYAAR